MAKLQTVWIGFDPREAAAFAVARSSIRAFNRQIAVRGVILAELQKSGFYTRPTEKRLGRFHDVISKTPEYDGAMSTEFAISRFFVPQLVKSQFSAPYGWALFIDCDVLVRANIREVLSGLDDSKALYCVQHDHKPTRDSKMDDVKQTSYARKNWSSVMAFNCDHPANEALTLELLNSVPGRDLHRFCWLKDEDIGALDSQWNYLVGHTETDKEPKIVHFTDGGPWFTGFDNIEYADEWRDSLQKWAAIC